MSSYVDYYNRTWNASTGSQMHACNCIGPRNGEPLCPCRMRGVRIQDGRYVEVIDHGPVSPEAQPFTDKGDTRL